MFTIQEMKRRADRKIYLNRDQIVDAGKKWLDKAGAEELLYFMSEILGGESTMSNGEYTFIPDFDNYAGVFKDVELSQVIETAKERLRIIEEESDGR